MGLYLNTLTSFPKWNDYISYSTSYFGSEDFEICCSFSQINEFINQIYKWIDESTIDIFEKIALFKEIFALFQKDYLSMSKIFKYLEEFDINSPDRNGRIQCLLSVPITKEFYVNGIYSKFLMSDDPKIISLLLKNISSLPPSRFDYKDELLPFTLISRTFKKIQEHTRKDKKSDWNIDVAPLLQITHRIAQETYFPKQRDIISKYKFDFNSENIVFKQKLDIKFVKDLLRFVLSDDVDKKQSNEIEDMIYYLCLLTLQNLEPTEIESLKQDYLSLLPFIFKYNNGRKISDRKNSDRGQTNLYFIKKYYGEDLIEKESIKHYTNWTKSTIKSTNVLFNVIGLISAIGDSEHIKSNINKVYKLLIDGFKLGSTEVPHQISSCLLELVDRYPNTMNDKRLAQLHKYLKDFSFIYDYQEKYQKVYEVFSYTYTVNPAFTMEHLDFLIKITLDRKSGQKSNILAYINRILVDPGVCKAIETSTRFSEIYEKIKQISKKSEECNIYLLEYLMKYESNQSLKEMAIKFEKGINSNKRWTIRDNKFFHSLLTFHERLESPNLIHFSFFEKTIRAFVKEIQNNNEQRSNLNLGVIMPFCNNQKKVEYLFNQVTELLNKPSSTVEIFKHFIQVEKFGETLIKESLSLFQNKKATLHRHSFSISNHALVLLKISKFMDISDVTKEYLLSFFTRPHLLHSEREKIAKILIGLITKLINFPEFYMKFIKSLGTLKPSTNSFPIYFEIFVIIHKSISDIGNRDVLLEFDYEKIQNYLVNKIITYWDFTDISLEVILSIIKFFKPIQLIQDSLRSSIIGQFKSCSSSRKRSILNYIKKKDIKVLEFLQDFKIAGFKFNPDTLDEDFSTSTPYVQNMIVQKILRYIYQDKFTSTNDYLSLALTSKIFFNEITKIFKNMRLLKPIQQMEKKTHNSITPIYAVNQNQWSFYSLGCYHMSYELLKKFRYQSAESIFYQLSSLSVSSETFYYLVNQDLNITSLQIVISSITLEPILNLVKHCHKLEQVDFDLQAFPFTTPKRNWTLLKDIVESILNHNSTALNKFTIKTRSNKDQPDGYLLSIPPLLKLLKNHEKTYKDTTGFVYIVFNRYGNFNYSFPQLRVDFLKKVANNCHRLDLETFDRDLLLVGNNFKRLKKVDIRLTSISSLIQESPFHQFLVSPLNKIESLQIYAEYSSCLISFQELCNHSFLSMIHLKKISLIIVGDTQDPAIIQCYNKLFQIGNSHPTITLLKIYHRNKDSPFNGATDYNFGEFQCVSHPSSKVSYFKRCIPSSSVQK